MAKAQSAETAGTDCAQEYIAGWLSPQEFRILESVCETFLPSLEPPAGSSEELAAFYRLQAGDVALAQLVAEAAARESEAKRAEIHQLFSLMASPVLGLLLIGTSRPFVELPLARRERYLLALANSPVGKFRQGYQAFKRLIGLYFFGTPTRSGKNPSWQLLGYEVPAKVQTQNGERPIKPLAITGDTQMECDAVIIGSGAGGGLVAGELARAGKDVIVLEKGGYASDSDFSLQEVDAISNLYLHRGTLTSADMGMTILAGSTLGGGTVVNWCTSFRTPDDVLSQWEQLSGLKAFTGPALQESFAAVEQRIHVNSENSAHNRQNQLLFDGAQALGYHAGYLRRNAVDCEQRCGTCGFGCRYGCKQSTTKTYLQDAYDCGARILVHCSVNKILIANGRAVGVRALASDPVTEATHEVTVRAKAVIVAAGAIHSPALLLRSGLDNPHIGRHLFLHPTGVISGYYPDRVNAWQGVMQSAYSDEFAHLDGNYGYKLEVPPIHPGMLGMALPWHSARAYREHASKAAYSASFIVLVRDRGEGRITLDREGEAVIHYVPSAYDRRHLLHGLRQAARIHFAAGAIQVLSLHSRPTMVERGADEALSERQWRQFDAQLERHGLGPNRLMLFSAHQMGTCRMGIDARHSVVDGSSQVHGTEGLFVCDGSVFPAPSGTNPMLSIMALAHRSAQYIKSIL